jgi:prevent-host-death family protein
VYVISYAFVGGKMATLNASDARANLYRLIDQTNESHEPVTISGKRNNAVLVAEGDWKSIQETLYLVSIPGLRESIVEGMSEPLTESSKDLDW